MDENSRAHLRNLAATYAEYALSETMTERRDKWRSHNSMKEKTYPFHIEDNGTFFRDLCPPLECNDPAGCELEARLVRSITAYERIDDDRIIPDRFVVDWTTTLTSYCDELFETHATDSRGGSLGYKTNRPIKDIDGDFHKLRKRTLKIDRERTSQRMELAEQVFQGLLPVEIGRTSSLYSNGITSKAVLLMGMQELYLQMAANPDAVHRLLTAIADDNYALGQFEEEQELLTLNNDGNQGYCSGSSQYTDEVPGREITAEESIKSSDRFGYLEAQEAAGISPDMFAEFIMPHFMKLSQKFKVMKFGCCEPVHDLMPHLHKLHGLRKVSVTPWCNQEKLATVCDKDVIWSRKPVPLKLCGDVFDPADFRSHLQETLNFGADFFIEFIFRDTCLLTGKMDQRLGQACDIVRDVTGCPEGRKSA